MKDPIVAYVNYYVIRNPMQTLKQDVVYALRTLAKSPGYAAVTILTLALGIGANTAIFSVVNGVMLKPLPYPQPGAADVHHQHVPGLGFDRFWVSLPEWAEFKERNHSFQGVGAYREGSVNLGTPERPRRVNSTLVTPELLTCSACRRCAAGSSTTPTRCPAPKTSASSRTATWQSDFGGDESVVGRVVQIDGVPTRDRRHHAAGLRHPRRAHRGASCR